MTVRCSGPVATQATHKIKAFKALKNHEVNPEQSPLIQMALKLQAQTNTTNNIQHQDTETSIHKIQPNQIIKTQQENDLTYWKETTEKLSKLECNLALNRDYTTAENLSTVKDCKLRRWMMRYRLSNHTLTIETGRYRQHWLPKESRICPYCTHGEVEREIQMHYIYICYKQDTQEARSTRTCRWLSW